MKAKMYSVLFQNHVSPFMWKNGLFLFIIKTISVVPIVLFSKVVHMWDILTERS
jgi:hypothetical protein